MSLSFFTRVLLALGFGATNILAAIIPGAFQQINCDGGGWFEQVIPHTSGRLYGRTDVGGLYRSDNHGDTWQFLSGDLPTMACHLVQGVAVAASNPDIVWQAVGTSYSRDADDHGRGIWKSANGGTTWTQVLADVTFSGNDAQRWGGECVVIQPGSNDTELWAGSRGEGLFHSTDGGNTWARWTDNKGKSPFRVSLTKPESNVLISGILIYPATATTPEHLWVYGDKGAWLSVDHGVKWTKRISSMTRVYRMTQLPDGTTFATGITAAKNALVRITSPDWKKTVFKITDIYKKTLVRNAPTKGYLGALDFPPAKESHLATVQLLANGELWAADLFENTCKSSDNGDHFTRLPMTLTGPQPGWATPGDDVIDGGHNGLIEDPAPRANPNDPHYLFLGGGYAPFRSGDGGATWQFIHRGIGETVAWRANFDASNHERIWLPLADLGCTVVTDGGTSGASAGYIAPHFQPTESEPNADIVMFTRRLLISAGHAVAAGGEQTGHRARLYHSTDNGATWVKIANELTATGKSEVLDAVASPADFRDVLVVLGGTGGVYRTTNILDEAATAKGVKFVKAVGLPAFDAGSEFNVNVSLDRDPVDANVCYLLLRGKAFYMSADGGTTWTNQTAGLDSTFGVLHVDAGTRRVWLGFPSDAGVANGLIYHDFGVATWTPLSGVQSVDEFDARDGRLAIIGQLNGDTFDHIHYSANAGGTWGEITRTPGFRFPTAQAVAVDPYHIGTVWISTNGRAIARFKPQ